MPNEFNIDNIYKTKEKTRWISFFLILCYNKSVFTRGDIYELWRFIN
jgi:hypothetical protein